MIAYLNPLRRVGRQWLSAGSLAAQHWGGTSRPSTKSKYNTFSMARSDGRVRVHRLAGRRSWRRRWRATAPLAPYRGFEPAPSQCCPTDGAPVIGRELFTVVLAPPTMAQTLTLLPPPAP